MTNLEWIRTLSAKELSDLLYDYWLPRGQYVWTDSRKGLVKMLGETYLERDCDKCKHQGNCYCVKGFGCPFEPKTENSSEKPNNCEHITEDGVTCAKYPACDDCLDNPLNKLKGSERLVKGSEKPNNCEDWQDWKDRMWAEAIVTEPTISKMEQVDKDINVRSKDCETCKHYKLACELFSEICKYEPTTQTETQNSNLTFEKRTMRDCYNCKRYETEGECIECRYEPKDEPQICDTCRYYNSYIPCGSTPSACKEADKFAEEFVEGLKKLKPKVEPQDECAKEYEYLGLKELNEMRQTERSE